VKVKHNKLHNYIQEIRAIAGRTTRCHCKQLQTAATLFLSWCYGWKHCLKCTI